MIKYMLPILVAVSGITCTCCHQKSVAPGTDIFMAPNSFGQKRVSDLGLQIAPVHNLGVLNESNIRFADVIKEAGADYRASADME